MRLDLPLKFRWCQDEVTTTINCIPQYVLVLCCHNALHISSLLRELVLQEANLFLERLDLVLGSRESILKLGMCHDELIPKRVILELQLCACLGHLERRSDCTVTKK